MQTQGALNGVQVLEIGNYIAGPYAGSILADLGATVLKIEEPASGDVVRSFEPRIDGTSSAHRTLNRNKHSVALDLKDPDALTAFIELVRNSDILIENLRPGAMDRLGLGYMSMSEVNPRLIYLSASGWGQDGALAADAGLDIMAQARSGLMSITGEPNGDPLKAGVPICDIGCAMYGAVGVLAALHARQQTGLGQHIDVSLYETGVSFSIWEFAKFTATGEIPTARGSVHQTAAPYQAVRAVDGWLTIGAATPRTWIAFAKAMNLGELIEDVRFIDNDARMRNRVALIEIIESHTTQEPVEHWLQVLSQAGVPVAPIQNYKQVYSDRALVERDFFWSSIDENGREVSQMGSPIRLSRTPTVRHSPGPELGGATRRTLTNIGYDPKKIQAMAASGAIHLGSEESDQA